MVTTNFFSELKKLNLKQLSFSVVFLDDIMTVSVLPKSNATDNATKLNDLRLSGTSEDLDTHFFDKLNTPLKNTAVFFDNVENYEKEQAEKLKETQQAKNLKKEIEKLEEKLTKVVGVEDFNIIENKDAITSLYTKLLAMSKTNTLANYWEKEIKKLDTPKLF